MQNKEPLPLLYLDLEYWKENLFLSLVAAPVIPVSWGMWMVALASVVCLLGWGLMQAGRYKSYSSTYSEHLSRVFQSERIKESMSFTVTNCLTTLLVVGWLGAAGLLTSLESFFTALATLQILVSTALMYNDFNSLRRDDLNANSP